MRRSGHSDEGITIATTPVATASPAPNPTGPTFANEQERAHQAIAVFQAVAAKYGDPYKTEARYFIGTNLLYVDREKGMTELAEVSKSGLAEPAALAKFALAQAKEADAKYDEAAKLHSELAAQKQPGHNARYCESLLAGVYVKQGKKKEAADTALQGRGYGAQGERRRRKSRPAFRGGS